MSNTIKQTRRPKVGSSGCSARWARTIIKLENFGRKWVTISCLGWSSERTAKIGLHELPKTIRPLAGSYIIAPNAAHIWRGWDRPGSTLVSVVECDANGLPV